jgi:hypothetical protein
VVLEDPRVRLRTNGQVYGRLLERVTDPALKKRVGEALAEKYGFDAKKAAADDTTWYFHYTTQASQR